MSAFQRQITWTTLVAVMLAGAGCHSIQRLPAVPPVEAPRELDKAILPEYIIEPPDLLTIDAINIIPKSSYQLRTTDVLLIDVQGTIPEAPISGQFPVQLGGIVELGPAYGDVNVAGLTLAESEQAIYQQLRKVLRDPKISVSLAEISGRQQIAGEHLVGPDGKVTLGSYGKVSVVGLTVPDAKLAVEQHLAQYLDSPEVSVDVFGYNSKVYYVITEGAVGGDGVYRFPNTGNETVLDAISQIQGLASDSSLNIWVARPAPDGGPRQILPVNWCGVTRNGDVTTNYQVLPGDRVYVASDKLVKLDTQLAKLFSPFERIFGFTILGTATATRLSGRVLRGGGNPIGRGGVGGI